MYTLLMAGYCAFVLEHHGFTYVALGKELHGTCETFLTLGSGSTVPPLHGVFEFPVHVEIDEFKAVVTIEDRNYVVPRERAL